MRNSHQHVVRAACHRHIDRPVAGLCQLGGADFERQGRQHQRVCVGVVNLDITPLGGLDFFTGQRELETFGRCLDCQGLDKDGLRLGVEDQR